jgi:glycosyltransferase involved in cell wall biosynthesis
MKKPKISIITVSWNDGATIGKTIESVINQNYKNIEHIIIDGASNDETLDIIKTYEDFIAYWISEPDSGIYAAMNKGIQASTGDVLYFLNADDVFVDSKVLTEIAEVFSLNPQVDYVYGGIFYKDPYGVKNYNLLMMEEISESDFIKGKMIRHQALFVKREIFRELKNFNENLRIASDLDFEYKMLKSKKKGLFVKRVITIMSSDGISSNIDACLIEKTQLMRKYFGGSVAVKYKIYRSFKNRILKFLMATGLIKGVLFLRKLLNIRKTLY